MTIRSLALLLPFVAGCGLMNGGGAGGGRRGRSTTPTPQAPRHVGVTLSNRCAQPVTICYGEDRCAVLAPDESRKVHAGRGLFVHLENATNGVFADATFSTVEIEENCKTLERVVGER